MTIAMVPEPAGSTPGVLRTLHRFMDSFGIGLLYRDPVSEKYHALCSVGYPTALMSFLATDFPRKDTTFHEVENNPEHLFCWRDFPDFQDSQTAQRWFRPLGISEGSSMILHDSAGH